MMILGGICLLMALGLFLRSTIVGRENELNLQERPGDDLRVAVLIPARDESAVIEGLLECLATQSFKLKPQDVFVIVESLDDPTVGICAKYRNNVVVRKDLADHPERGRKGYALDVAVKEILSKGVDYDVFFVFDADNILATDYIAKMVNYYRQGYDLATGYRNSKNGNQNVIAAVSSLTFSMINVMGNRERVKHKANVIFSGTGFFVDGELVREWGGWPFHGLTEDYEMSLYATLHGLKTCYIEETMFYDEQPLKYHQTVAQRVRWIRGYFDARKKYVPLMREVKHTQNYGSLQKEIIGVKPVIWVIAGILLLTLGSVIWLIVGGKWRWALSVVVGLLVSVYLVLMIVTIIMLKRERLDLSRSTKIKAIFFNPIYLVSYVPCALKAIFTKKVEWTKIKHGE